MRYLMAYHLNQTAVLRGAASQARVVADLFDRGYCVFAALSNYGQGDLVAVKNGRCLLIEVKTGRMLNNGRLHHGRGMGRQGGYDVLAVVEERQWVFYEPSPEKWARDEQEGALEAPGSRERPPEQNTRPGEPKPG